MKVLYCARMCRYDLLHAIGRLACRVTKWDDACDRALHRLTCSIHHTYHIRQVGWVGDSADDVGIHLFADADFGWDKKTSRNTSGAFLCLAGPGAFFPIQAFSKKQTAVSHSTPEAEIVAADAAARQIGIPCLELWGQVLGRDMVCNFHEDNGAMIQVCKTGRNQTMRHLGRTHRIDVHWLHEVRVSRCWTRPNR
jgi:hypothetical protein